MGFMNQTSSPSPQRPNIVEIVYGCSYDTNWGNIVRLSEIEVYSTGTLAVKKSGKIAVTWAKLKEI